MQRRLTTPDAVPVGDVFADAVPADAVPADAVPADAVPAHALPADALPADAPPAGVVPAGALPPGAAPAGAVPVGAVPGSVVAEPKVPAPRRASRKRTAAATAPESDSSAEPAAADAPPRSAARRAAGSATPVADLAGPADSDRTSQLSADPAYAAEPGSAVEPVPAVEPGASTLAAGTLAEPAPITDSPAPAASDLAQPDLPTAPVSAVPGPDELFSAELVPVAAAKARVRLGRSIVPGTAPAEPATGGPDAPDAAADPTGEEPVEVGPGVRQLSLFGVEARAPAATDLEGLLAGPGQVVRMGGTARVSVVVAELWRAKVLVGELRARGLVATCVATADQHIGVRSAYATVLAPLGHAWLRGAVKTPPEGFMLDGRQLRLWVIAVGHFDDQGFTLALGAADEPTWGPAGVALDALGLAPVLLGPRAGGPGYRITGRRRLARLRELVGEPPPDAPPGLWPA